MDKIVYFLMPNWKMKVVLQLACDRFDSFNFLQNLFHSKIGCIPHFWHPLASIWEPTEKSIENNNWHWCQKLFMVNNVRSTEHGIEMILQLLMIVTINRISKKEE